MTETPAFRLVGMVHLPPLPGIPNYRGTPLSEIIDQAVADAVTLTDAGFTHLMIQNACDVPAQTTVAPSTIAIMTRVATEVSAASPLPLGVNVAHNDGPGALAVAYAVGAPFIRVKLLTGAAVGPDGIMAGCGLATAELRARLGADVRIWADVNEATSLPLARGADDVWAAVEAVKFGAADVLVVTKDSGVADALDAIARIREALPDTPLVVGGRVGPASIAATRAGADGAIIGGALKKDGGHFTRVDATLARGFAA
ncbi:BtpA/SgcQ family protein [Streptomyces sp. NPDC088261]|uniref:BtpA/SgcQ family protein n=1 Tax=Streptomyces sp. NPDC088261 TaxID=3365851 RepID=UPI0037F78657